MLTSFKENCIVLILQIQIVLKMYRNKTKEIRILNVYNLLNKIKVFENYITLFFELQRKFSLV